MQKTILLVEDNPDDEELTLRALKKSKPSIIFSVQRPPKNPRQRWYCWI
jgi:hypothetical protein